ncbi:hypothetical protein EVB41_072 [Rhizobium phage RHph_TM3_14A]|nr:hypothetical protein EVB29_073 [Rhizobium phage RHph_TM27A]QIG66993.1 hypothetical protein EVB30_073 [Rhizobium phage RHph_TM27B]QIG67081.1 hypothetical protein EVB31_071 [Rhizobium phage RHph_TM29]QIG67537.1 hypothetical protein EVB41_072 [Rhizobium phage RHph_TM3_14A]
MKALVIYYDGNGNKAKLVDTELPDSAQPHVHGLESNCDVIAVITGINFAEDLTVYIDEEEQKLTAPGVEESADET